MPDSNDPNQNSHGAICSNSLRRGRFHFSSASCFGSPIPASSFVDNMSLERIADRDTDYAPAHIHRFANARLWRAGGIQKMTPRGESFLKRLAGARASVIGRPVPVADMGRVMFFEDIFLQVKQT